MKFEQTVLKINEFYLLFIIENNGSTFCCLLIVIFEFTQNAGENVCLS